MKALEHKARMLFFFENLIRIENKLRMKSSVWVCWNSIRKLFRLVVRWAGIIHLYHVHDDTDADKNDETMKVKHF